MVLLVAVHFYSSVACKVLDIRGVSGKPRAIELLGYLCLRRLCCEKCEINVDTATYVTSR